METLALPIKLSKEPLIDAVFEVRFTSNVPASSVLPGIMFSKLEGVSSVETLPAAQLPPQVRAMNPELRFAPLTRVTWGKTFIAFGDSVLGVSSSIPYPGWQEFKARIIEVLRLLEQATFISSIDRWSLKYTDLFDATAEILPLKHFNGRFRIGHSALTSENLQLRVELPREGYLQGVQIVTSATVQLINGEVKTGTILEVDTIRSDAPMKTGEFLRDLEGIADEIHTANKKFFFECLSEEGLKNLGPVYA